MGVMLSVSLIGQPRTVRDLLWRSYKIAKVLAKDEPMSPEQAVEGLWILSDIIEQVSLDKTLSVFEHDIHVPLVENQTAYRIGPDTSDVTPHVVAPRPTEILSAYSVRNGLRHDVTVGHAKAEYDRRSAGFTIVNGVPCAIYYQPTFPVGTVHLSSVPVDGDTELYLTVLSQLTPYTTLEDDVILPPGYLAWLQYGVAYRLCSDYGTIWSQANVDIFDQLERTIRQHNIKPLQIADVGLTGLSIEGTIYNIMTDR